MVEGGHAVRQDSLSITLTLLSAAIFFCAFTWGGEMQLLSVFLVSMMTFGLVLNITLVGRVPVDTDIDAEEGSGILLWTALAVGVIAAGSFVAPLVLPSILMEAYARLSLLDARLFGVLIAVSEEQFFRGFMAPYLANRLGFTLGILSQGVLFGVYHFSVYGGNPQALLVVTTAGVALGFIALRTRRLSPVVLAHALVNFIAAGGFR